jgi:hypothetical protein
MSEVEVVEFMVSSFKFVMSKAPDRQSLDTKQLEPLVRLFATPIARRIIRTGRGRRSQQRAAFHLSGLVVCLERRARQLPEGGWAIPRLLVCYVECVMEKLLDLPHRNGERWEYYQKKLLDSICSTPPRRAAIRTCWRILHLYCILPWWSPRRMSSLGKRVLVQYSSGSRDHASQRDELH